MIWGLDGWEGKYNLAKLQSLWIQIYLISCLCESKYLKKWSSLLTCTQAIPTPTAPMIFRWSRMNFSSLVMQPPWMKNKVCLYVASVDVGVLLEPHCKQMLCIQFTYESSSFSASRMPHSLTADILRHGRNTDRATRSEKSTPPMPPAPFVLSPPPCRCWMDGPCGRKAQWESYSSCQVPLCFFRLWSESRHC